MSTAPRTKPNDAGAESNAKTTMNNDPILVKFSVPLVNRTIERNDAIKKIEVETSQSVKAVLLACPIKMKAVAIPREPISARINAPS